MKHISILIILLALVTANIKAQSERVEPFVDAVPYSIHNASNLYLTNQDAAEVKTFYTAANRLQPYKILAVDEGYYHGYRLCYKSADSENQEMADEWIQVVTVNLQECVDWYEKTNPEFLMVPFAGIVSIVGNKGHSRADFRKVYTHYKHLACELYQQSQDPGDETNVLSMVLHTYNTKISLQTNQMLASGDYDVIVTPGSNREDYWDLWMQCLEDIDDVGYTTLIEYSQAPGTGFFR